MWRWYQMRAHGDGLDVRETYAPDLDNAFAWARSEWPRASAWECVGSHE